MSCQRRRLKQNLHNPGEVIEMEMTTEELDKGVTKINLNGRLDVVAAGQIEMQFSAIADARRAVVVDLSHVTFLATMGIRMLLLGAKIMASKGGKMALLAPIADVAGVLRTARIDALIPIYDQRDAALAGVDA
jgi:anti-anti-sigma factor